MQEIIVLICDHQKSSNISCGIHNEYVFLTCGILMVYEIGHAAGGSPMGIVCVPNRCGFAWVPRWEVWKFTDPTNSGPQKNTLRKVTLWQTNSSRTGKSPSLSSVNQLFQCAMFNSYFDITRWYTFIQDDPKMGKVTFGTSSSKVLVVAWWRPHASAHRCRRRSSYRRRAEGRRMGAKERKIHWANILSTETHALLGFPWGRIEWK